MDRHLDRVADVDPEVLLGHSSRQMALDQAVDVAERARLRAVAETVSGSPRSACDMNAGSERAPV
jgi:hypothetical protein